MSTTWNPEYEPKPVEVVTKRVLLNPPKEGAPLRVSRGAGVLYGRMEKIADASGEPKGYWLTLEEVDGRKPEQLVWFNDGWATELLTEEEYAAATRPQAEGDELDG